MLYALDSLLATTPIGAKSLNNLLDMGDLPGATVDDEPMSPLPQSSSAPSSENSRTSLDAFESVSLSA